MIYLRLPLRYLKRDTFRLQFTITSRESSPYTLWGDLIKITCRTNVPAIAMSFSDIPFAYGPFVPHHIPRQYVESYFSKHKLDSSSHLSLNTTVEDLSLINKSSHKEEHWKLVLRKHDPAQRVDKWWEEEFDAVVLANGHYSVPFVWTLTSFEKLFS